MSKKEIYEEMGLKIKEHQQEIKKLAAARWELREEEAPARLEPPVFPGGFLQIPAHPFDEPRPDTSTPPKKGRVKCTDRVKWGDAPRIIRENPGITPEGIVKIKFPKAKGRNKRGFISKCNMALWAFQYREGIIRSEVKFGRDGRRRRHYYPVDPVDKAVPLQFDFSQSQSQS